MIGRICVLAAMMACATWASGQIIYEPVRYQYGDGPKFYYGGRDPAILAYGYAQHDSLPLTIYTDARQYENAAVYGYSTNDARNEAYANAPRYFRMRDLIAAGNLMPDGTIVVGAQAQPISTQAGPAMTSAQRVLPRAILIIPRGQPVPPPPKSNNVTITMNSIAR
jgi:hypothetical protein